ncbi:MAG: hypothetical protein KAJ24_07425 [Candidatus Aenigmarchaeota archaeon]|nr:hypothetical protein [Candidatus Aenigmarchaeota archaeon]
MAIRRKLDKKEEWENMVDFSSELIKRSERHRETGVVAERIAILHLDHANELLMKAFLMRKKYLVSYLNESAVKKGIKESDFLDKSKTMKYADCLELVLKELDLPSGDKERLKKVILKFHKLRNEIQHRAINIPLDREEQITNFRPCLQELLNLMFGDVLESSRLYVEGMCLECGNGRLVQKQETLEDSDQILIIWQCEYCGNIDDDLIVSV